MADFFERMTPQEIAEMKAKMEQMANNNQAMAAGINAVNNLGTWGSAGFILGNIIGNRINGLIDDRRTRRNNQLYEDHLKSQQFVNQLKQNQGLNLNFNSPSEGGYTAESLGNWGRQNWNFPTPRTQSQPNNQSTFNSSETFSNIGGNLGNSVGNVLQNFNPQNPSTANLLSNDFPRNFSPKWT